MKDQLLFLGSGGSTGTPMIGCHCPICQSLDPYNKRLRPSALVTVGGKRLLIDAGPDLRFQALHNKIEHIDGVLLTHTHFDHVAGLDELRSFYLHSNLVMPVLASESSLADLRRRYDYLFREKSRGVSLAAQIDWQVLQGERGTVDFLGIEVGYMTYEQGGMQVNGYRFGSLAYVSDIRSYQETIFDELKGLDVLILGALRFETSPMHFSISEAIEFAKRVGAKETFFTHISHRLDHQEGSKHLPEHVALAYDGLTVEFSYGR